MNKFNTNFSSIQQISNQYLQKNQKKNYYDTYSSDFADILKEQQSINQSLKFSKHANQRLESRNINLSNEQLERLNNGVSKAREKSINETLVMMDNLVFIVNTKNNTVITAISQGENKENIFTNIDGAVII